MQRFKTYFFYKSESVWWTLLCLLLLAPHAYSHEKVLAVVSHNTPLYENFFNSLRTKLVNVKTLEKTDVASVHDTNLNKFDLVISIGSDASEILSRTEGINNLISTLIPANLSESITNRPCLAGNCTSVLIEQPVYRYFQLFKSIFPNTRTLVVATTSPNSKYLSNLKAIAKRFNVRLRITSINKDTIIARSLINKLDKNDVLLALPDPNIYNKSTAKSIILSAYHKNVPIIAYSKAFAKAGALVSLYSSFEDIADQTAKLTNLPGPANRTNSYPNSFSIEINSSVARSMNIEINDVEVIKRAIK